MLTDWQAFEDLRWLLGSELVMPHVARRRHLLTLDVTVSSPQLPQVVSDKLVFRRRI